MDLMRVIELIKHYGIKRCTDYYVREGKMIDQQQLWEYLNDIMRSICCRGWAMSGMKLGEDEREITLEIMGRLFRNPEISLIVRMIPCSWEEAGKIIPARGLTTMLFVHDIVDPNLADVTCETFVYVPVEA